MHYGFCGRCSRFGNKFVTDWDHYCYSGEYKESSEDCCGDCEHYKAIPGQNLSLINTPGKYQCVHQCDHYDGFCFDRLDRIFCGRGRCGDVIDFNFETCQKFIPKKGIKLNKLLDRFEDLVEV